MKRMNFPHRRLQRATDATARATERKARGDRSQLDRQVYHFNPTGKEANRLTAKLLKENSK